MAGLSLTRWEPDGGRDVLAAFERTEHDFPADLQRIERRSYERAVSERVFDAIVAGDDAALLMIDQLRDAPVHQSAFLAFLATSSGGASADELCDLRAAGKMWEMVPQGCRFGRFFVFANVSSLDTDSRSCSACRSMPERRTSTNGYFR